MGKFKWSVCLGALVALTSACTITPPRVAVTAPYISVPDVFVMGGYDYGRDNYPSRGARYESHDRRDFGRAHNGGQHGWEDRQNGHQWVRGGERFR